MKCVLFRKINSIYCMIYVHISFRWHFVCSDIFETIENIIQTEFTIESFGFYGSKDPEGKSFFIDELSFSEQKRSIENVCMLLLYCCIICINYCIFIPIWCVQQIYTYV